VWGKEVTQSTRKQQSHKKTPKGQKQVPYNPPPVYGKPTVMHNSKKLQKKSPGETKGVGRKSRENVNRRKKKGSTAGPRSRIRGPVPQTTPAILNTKR